MSAIELAKKYDRSLTVVITALGVIATIYLATGSKIDAMVAQTPTIQELRKVDAVQANSIDTMKSDIKIISEDVKTILRTMPRR